MPYSFIFTFRPSSVWLFKFDSKLWRVNVDSVKFQLLEGVGLSIIIFYQGVHRSPTWAYFFYILYRDLSLWGCLYFSSHVTGFKF